MKRSKRYRKNLENIVETKKINEAVEFLKNQETVKFDESVEVHADLNIDPKKTEQQIRMALEMPHGSGKSVKVAVFAEGDVAKEAEKAKADYVFGQADIERIMNKKTKIDFDAVVAHPTMMPKLAKIAKILGPKGLMPSPKNETVTPNVAKVVEKLKKGMLNLKNDSGANIHLSIGKLSFKTDELVENYKAFIDALEKQKPEKSKGKFIKKVYVSSTMGPSIKISG